jgi:hypothetical protein
LEEVAKAQQKNHRSSDWEKFLVQSIQERTDLFDVGVIQNIHSLEKHRHLCAHPVLDNEFELYQPNKETARAHIRNMSEGVFLKSALLSSKIFSNLVIDIAEKSNIFATDQDLQVYLESKYFTKSSLSSIRTIFKNLRKFVFNLNSLEGLQNRSINTRSLHAVVKYNPQEIMKFFQDNKAHFSNSINEGNSFEIIQFLSRHDYFFALLEDQAKIQIRQTASTDKNAHALAWFLSDDIVKHINVIEKVIVNHDEWPHGIGKETMKSLVEIAKDRGALNEGMQFAVNRFVSSSSFNAADSYFAKLIEPNLDHFTKDQIEQILQGVHSNYQIHARHASSRDNFTLREFINKKFVGVPKEKYPKVFT